MKMPGVCTCSGESAPTGTSLVHLGADRLGGGRHDRVEIAHRAAVDEVAEAVAAMAP